MTTFKTGDKTMELKIGRIYDVNSSRKGDFRIKLINQDETWATGLILKGKAKAINHYNERETGEEVTMRKELTHFKEVEDEEQELICDCQDPENGLASMSCPIHNTFPIND